MKISFLSLTTALLAAASTCSPFNARAQETATPPTAPTTVAASINPVARQLMVQTFNAYRALNSYGSDVTWQESGDSKNSGTGRVTWQKPARIAVQVATKGSTQTNIFNGAKFIASRTREGRVRYISEAASVGRDAMMRALEPLDISGIGLSAGLLGRSPLQLMGEQIVRVSTRKATADDTRGLDESAEALNLVEVALQPRQAPSGPQPFTVTFLSARADNLLRRVRIAIGTGAKAQSVTETYRKVQVNPVVDAKSFTYAPPLRAKRVSEFASGYDERLEVGVAPFAIETNALDGKKLSLSNYKNQVLLLDFWATWCPPCREEMPNVIANYNKYHRRGFDILGVSLDQSKGALDNYLKQNKMPWRQVFDGKGWQSAVAGTYGVQSIPFTLLIGRDGRIAAINPRGPQLEAAIKAALAKKSG